MSSSKVHTFLQRGQIRLMMYSYVKAVRRNMPTVTVAEAIQQFLKEFDLLGQDVDEEYLRTSFYNLDKEYINCQKSQ